MSKHWLVWSWIAIMAIFLLVACDSANNNNDSVQQVTNAVGDINAQTTEDVTPSTVTPTPVRRSTLPSTFTPTPTVTPTLTPTATDTPEGFNPYGTLFYIYNGDSIVRMVGDGSLNQLIVTFGVGMQISELTLSPDGSLLAFIGPGNGSAREVFVSNLTGTYLQQVSCLGFADVHSPSWSPDSASLAFIGAQALGQPRNIYTVNIAGSGNCPVDNNQQQLTTLDSLRLADVAWHPDGERLFFSNEVVYALELATGNIIGPYTETLGFGEDFFLRINPVDNSQMIYLRPNRNSFIEVGTGALTAININVGGTGSVELSIISPSFVMWSSDGENVLASTLDSITLIEYEPNRPNVILRNLPMPPQAIFTTSNDNFAYISVDPVNPAIQQVFSYSRRTRQTSQLTNHPEGTASDLIWIPE